MINRICGKCGSHKVVDAGSYAGSSFCTCETCGQLGLREKFPEMTVFHHITPSPEVLAPCLVYAHWFPDSVKPVFKSTIQVGVWETSDEALAATLARLTEVYSE